MSIASREQSSPLHGGKRVGSGGSPTWTNLVADDAAGSPPWRIGHVAAYDAEGNRMIVFGGHGRGTDYNDVWVLLHANGLP